MALRPRPASPPLKSADCPRLFPDTISLGHLLRHLICFWWPCRDVVIHTGKWISLWLCLLRIALFSFFSPYFPLSVAHRHTLPTCTVGKYGSLWLSHPCVLIQEITSMIGHTYGPPVSSAKHFGLSLWGEADDVTSHIYYPDDPRAYLFPLSAPSLCNKMKFIIAWTPLKHVLNGCFCLCFSSVTRTVRTAVRGSSTWTPDALPGVTESSCPPLPEIWS